MTIPNGTQDEVSCFNSAEQWRQKLPSLAAIIDEMAQAATNAEGILDYAYTVDLSAHIENVFRRILIGPVSAITDVILRAREPYKEHVFGYLNDLIAAGVTPDEALQFIAECEVPNTPDALRAFSQGLNKISEQVATFLQLPAIQGVLAKAINDVLSHFGEPFPYPDPSGIGESFTNGQDGDDDLIDEDPPQEDEPTGAPPVDTGGE